MADNVKNIKRTSFAVIPALTAAAARGNFNGHSGGLLRTLRDVDPQADLRALRG